MGLRALGRMAFLAALPVLLAGCDLLAAALYPQLDPFAPDPFGQPGAPTAYEGGTATIEIRQGDQLQTVVLDELVPGSELWEMGAMATWRNSDGWALTVNAYSAHPMDPFGSGGDITLQRVTGTELWATDYTTTYERCLVQIGEMSEERLRGSVDCDGLRWVDGLGGMPVLVRRATSRDKTFSTSTPRSRPRRTTRHAPKRVTPEISFEVTHNAVSPGELVGGGTCRRWVCGSRLAADFDTTCHRPAPSRHTAGLDRRPRDPTARPTIADASS